MSLNKPIESIVENDLQSLVTNQFSEAKTVEYKQELKIRTDGEKKEFLYDVGSFANAVGGHLIYGMKAADGVPTELCGLDTVDVDALILRLESSIRDGIKPRIPGVTVHPVPLHNRKTAIVIHIPRSWARPHMVTYQNASKFYARDGRGKYPLDVEQIRAAFALSETAAEQIRNFRRERLGMIVAGETPFSLPEGAKLVLHIIPIGAFDFASQLNIASLIANPPQPLSSPNATSYKINFDGIVSFSSSSYRDFSSCYLQLFRNGIIEAVETTSCFITQNDTGLINTKYEHILLKALPSLFNAQKYLGVEPPLFIMLSLLGVKGYSIGQKDIFGGQLGDPIDRNDLLTTEIMIEEFNVDFSKIMKPTFDSVWNAAGVVGSNNYDEAGNWHGKRY